MSEDATPEQKAIYEQFKNVLRNLQNNSQSGLILPSSVDPETREKLFDVQLLATEGKKNYDTTLVKEYYRNMIFIGMNADILLMGNTQTGSFALGSLKTSLTGAFVEGMLKRIMQVLNGDLVKQIYELNGWDISRRATIDYEGFSEVDTEAFSKFVQRIASVGYLPKTVAVVNTIVEQLGLDPLPEDTNLDEILPESTSRAGDGMKTAGTGTSTSTVGDGGDSNLDNTA
jgi:hypothetical protein